MAIKIRKLVWPVSGDQVSIYASQAHGSPAITLFPLPTGTIFCTYYVFPSAPHRGVSFPSPPWVWPYSNPQHPAYAIIVVTIF